MIQFAPLTLVMLSISASAYYTICYVLGYIFLQSYFLLETLDLHSYSMMLHQVIELSRFGIVGLRYLSL